MSSASVPAQLGRYRILSKLGQGGMGSVYLAEDTTLARRVAVKVPHFSEADGPKVIERFQREARVAAGIDHPNLCPVHDFGEVQGVHYLVMPYIEGTPLSHLIDEDNPWPPPRAAALVRQLALALEVLHQRGLIHRDLKPSNVLLRPGGEPVLMDFGLARSYTEQSRRLTQTGAALGTPAYMAPEQILGDARAIGPATDVYELGVILYELLTGHLPFEGPPAAVYGQILHAQPLPPSSRRPGLDAGLDGVCGKALAKKPAERFAGMAALAEALKPWACPVAVVANPPAPSPRPISDVPRITCQGCGKSLKVPPTVAGKRLQCPRCRTVVAAAVATQFRPAPGRAAAETAVPSPLETAGAWPPRPFPQVRSNRGRIPLLASLIGVALLATTLTIWLVTRDQGKQAIPNASEQVAAKKLTPPPQAKKPAPKEETAPVQEKKPLGKGPAPVSVGRGEDPTKPIGVPGGFGGRSGAARLRLLNEGGGTAASEEAVAKGLRWLALHQAPNGGWSLDQFNLHARTNLSDTQYRVDPRATGKGMRNDTAGAAFGLLPFLAAGITHKPSVGKKSKDDIYVKTVARGLSYLLSKQNKDGSFPDGMYAHGLATIAVCEAYGLTSDPNLERHAQAALNFIVYAQDPASGGWRYAPRQGGDTSVLGWQVMALMSGRIAGLNVPDRTLKGAEKWLDSCETPDKGGYGYTGPQETPTLTAVGLLCRMYLGTPRRNPGLSNGANKLKRRKPTERSPNSYYEYYATQVMHHLGGDYWEFWNKGDKGFKGMRDILINRQEADGSWNPAGDGHASVGGRIMTTSLSLLTLEVYYRHLPLYQRQVDEK